MTRTTDEIKYEVSSWEHKGVTVSDDGRRLTSNADAVRPKGRIRRSMTACHTCRKLKTRCDLDPRGHACRRCLSLRIDCKLPETTDRFQDNASMWSDATSAIPSIEERLTSLERSMREMTSMMRQMLDQAPATPTAIPSYWTRGTNADDGTSSEGSPSSPFLPKPVRLIQDLQSEFFGEAENSSYLRESVAKGGLDSKLSLKLLQLFVDNFGPYVSIYNLSDIQVEARNPDSLLYNTACLLASRYVPGVPTSVVHALYLHVRHAVVNLLWDKPPLRYESLQALALLCLWPATVQKEPPMDSWLLSGVSINHAIIAFDCLSYGPTVTMIDNETATQLRLWNTYCLTQLHFAVGNARPFHIQQRYLDHCPRILEHPGATLDDAKMVAEIQLYLLTLRLQSNGARMRVADTRFEELERWKAEWAHLFAGEQSTLELSLWFCQILLQRTAMRFNPSSDTLASEVLQTSRLVLSKFLQIRYTCALSLVDQVYFMVGYAALNLCDFNLMDPLIEQVQMFLLHLSPNEDHIAYRFSCMIVEFKRRCAESSDPATAAAAAAAAAATAAKASSPVSSFGETRKMSMEQTAPFLPPMVDTMIEGYGFEQLMPEVLPQSFPGESMLNEMAVAGIPGYRSATL
ncbi:transcriptional activator of proteases prtT [Aspergillus saccharolyticus JOP 1030-1]|uniref:Transcriptional activator of proteases prtT n=1 Tax=Aspergillus saccharolyticus JOP 1030-1 TaxID=1450539 RepID=A0A318Z0C4_9EURO|nr:transcriptional activator of proteases prtT [Aspergillus saccharolyticus JOP 1030-1]PYH40359.1 transcriptional activator of proteases prtT [Aspergillus saccharolyticus JOP 1030-1]